MKKSLRTKSGMPTALIVGPSPPPYNGMSVANEFLLSSVRETIQVVHLDTADRRGLANVGKLELTNLFLAAAHGLKFLWLLLTRKPQIVYVPIAQAWLPFLRDCLFLVPARMARLKVIIHLHGSYFDRFYRQTSGVMRAIVRYSLSDVTAALVLGECGRGLFDGIIPVERIRVVPNGIPDYFREAPARTEAGLGLKLLYVGMLCESKGVLRILRALAELKDEFPAIRASFAGEWASQDEKSSAERIIEDFGLEPNVEFVGPVGLERKVALFRDADMFVFPSAYPFEGHPYTILESMAAGLPVISSDLACIPETVEDGVSGFLLEPGEIGGLSDRIRLLIRDERLRSRMGIEARRRFLQEYTLDRFAERMRSIFAETGQPIGQHAEETDLTRATIKIPR